MNDKKEVIVHFEGRDMPASEWLRLVHKRHSQTADPLLGWPTGDGGCVLSTAQNYRQMLRSVLPDLTEAEIDARMEH